MAAIGASGFLMLRGAADAETVTASIPAAQGRSSDLGDEPVPRRMTCKPSASEAKLINAALPFSADTLHAARPFALSGSELDQRRAMLASLRRYIMRLVSNRSTVVEQSHRSF